MQFLAPMKEILVRKNNGSALVLAMMLVFVVTILVPIGVQLVVNAFKESKHQQSYIAEAENVARAGLVDAIAWFKRQPQQPVRSGFPPTFQPWADGAFNPKFSTNPLHCDTIDESIGLVKEYPLSEDGLRWARYEVRRQTNPAVAPYEPFAVHDITAERLHTGEKSGEGLVWYLASTGYVYRRRNPAVPFNVWPNEIIAKVKVSTEIRRISLRLPAECAYIVKDGGRGGAKTVKIYNNGRIIGGNNIGCGRVSGEEPYLEGGATVTGNPAYLQGLDDPTVYYVLGVSTAELRLLADYVVTSVNALPTPLPDMCLIYIDGNATFDSVKPLRSSGILFVHGNLTISANSNSLYSGLIYVTGTATIHDPCLISGSVIAYGGLTLSRPNATDVAEINYDKSILDLVRHQICQYRENKSAYSVFVGKPKL